MKIMRRGDPGNCTAFYFDLAHRRLPNLQARSLIYIKRADVQFNYLVNKVNVFGIK